jgi:hypothetical protein
MHGATASTHRSDPAIVYTDGAACDIGRDVAAAAGSGLAVEAVRGPGMTGADMATGVSVG